MEKKIIITNDNSKTIFLPHLNETYHSIHGAIQEAKHVFTNKLIDSFQVNKQNEINILEIGLGTGLNVLLTYIETEPFNKVINYSAIEAFPLNPNLAFKMDYCSMLGNKYKYIFEKIHNEKWEEKFQISNNFSLKKLNIKIENYEPLKNKFDVIYYDAFGPKAQPEMWSINIFQKMYDILKLNGFLITYCAKGEVKRNLKTLGFKVETLQGPPGKREMTKAVKL
jgi:tRNA U34 5-methylaminomethyl-2-thiouridine-forming methyltransferase MnmC